MKHLLAFLSLTAAAVPLAQAATTVTLSSSSNPATYGRAVTFSAALTPNTLTGSVTFYAGTSVLGVAPVTGGTATFSTSQLNSGLNSILARFDGDKTKSAPLSETVNSIQSVGFPGFTPNNTANNTPNGIAVGDFNGDGKLDMAVPIANGVYIFLGSGGGNFQNPLFYSVGSALTSVAVGDFNGDGKLDLAVTDATDATGATTNYVWILLGNGNGSFENPVGYALGVSPNQVVVADFNGDGTADLAIAGDSFSGGSSTIDVNVMFGKGDGTFQSPANYSTGTVQTSAQSLVVGDFNLDGFPDLAVTNSGDLVGDTYNTVTILTGAANGTLTIGATLTVGNYPVAITAGDFNGDGKPDLAVGNQDDGTISVLLGNGNATFGAQTVYPIPVPSSFYTGTISQPLAIAVGDFNGDGVPDLATANYIVDIESGQVGSTVSIFPGTASGSFQAATNYTSDPGAIGMALGDLNGDGAIDVMLAVEGDGITTFGDADVLLAQGCNFQVSPSSIAVDNRGTNTFLTVTSSYPQCTWNASVNGASWIQTFPSTGSGTYSQTAVVIPSNVTGLERTGTITVGGQGVAVTEWATQQVFTDVPPSDYQFDAVDLLSQKGITNGCGTNTYCPGLDITRAQMAVFIVRTVYNGSDNFPFNPTPYFTDVPSNAFGFKWIQRMYELGITLGCGATTYCPTASVTRAQMAIFIIRARFAATTAFTYPTSPYFTDVNSATFGFQWIQRMREDQITSGCTLTTYCPNNPITRGDMAIFVMRGGFNQLLATGTPVIQAVSPSTLTHGTSNTFTVTGLNTHFVQGTTTVVGTSGLTVGTVTVNSPTSLTVTLTAASSWPITLPQPLPIYVQTEPEEAILPNGLTIQ